MHLWCTLLTVLLMCQQQYWHNVLLRSMILGEFCTAQCYHSVTWCHTHSLLHGLQHGCGMCRTLGGRLLLCGSLQAQASTLCDRLPPFEAYAKHSSEVLLYCFMLDETGIRSNHLAAVRHGTIAMDSSIAAASSRHAACGCSSRATKRCSLLDYAACSDMLVCPCAWS